MISYNHAAVQGAFGDALSQDLIPVGRFRTGLAAVWGRDHQERRKGQQKKETMHGVHCNHRAVMTATGPQWYSKLWSPNLNHNFNRMFASGYDKVKARSTSSLRWPCAARIPKFILRNGSRWVAGRIVLSRSRYIEAQTTPYTQPATLLSSNFQTYFSAILDVPGK